LATGEDMQTDYIRDEELFFVTETLRIAVYTPTLPSVPSRGNLHTAMIPVRAVHDAQAVLCVNSQEGDGWI
jgi:hypothetical protein